MTEYLSEKQQQKQEEFLNDCIIKINNNIQSGVIEVKYKDDTSDIEERAFTTDTHGDLISLMGAAVMCGVKFKENEFLYYDRNKGIYYEKANGKYYEYDLPYIGPKMVGEPKDSIEGILDNDKMELKKEEVILEGYEEEIDENLLRIEEGKKENTNIVVIPIPDTSNARDLYHLGDVLDRGQESLTSILLCEVCPTIKLAQGNHEFMDNMTALCNGSYVKEIKSINLILARMKINNRIVTGFYDGKDNDVISYSHIPLTEDRVAGFFSFLNAVYVNNKYTNGNPTVLEALDKEFKEQNQEELCNKIKIFLNKNNEIISDITKQNKVLKYNLYENRQNTEEEESEEIQNQIFENNLSIFENIKESFSKEEMLIVKNIINDALVKRRIKVEDNGKIYSIDEGAKTDIYDDYQELQGEAGNIINFDRYHEEHSICYAVKGHDYNPNSIEVEGEGKCLDIDDLKSAGYRGNERYKEYFNEEYGYNLKNESCVTITNLNIKTGTVNNYSFTAARKIEDNSIEDTFEKNIQGHQREMKLENFKLSPASINYSAKPVYKDKDDERHTSILMAIDKKDINEAKRLIKLGYRINVKKLSDSEKGIFENIKNSVKNLAINCNISKEKFDSFVLSDENREETVIEKFEKLNKVLEEIAKNEEKNICCEH